MPCPPATVAGVATIATTAVSHATPAAAGRWRIAALLIAAVTACTVPSAAPTSVEQAWSAVEALVGTPRCRTDGDCRSIGVGSRTCGGPERYVAWSTLVSDAAALNGAVAHHAALRRVADEKAGRSSTCVVAEEPAVSCRKADAQAWGVCVADPVTRGPQGSSTQR